MSAMPMAACVCASAAMAFIAIVARKRYTHASTVVTARPNVISARSRRISRSSMLGVGPVHFGGGGVFSRPFETKVAVLRTHGRGRRDPGVVPEKPALRVGDVDFLLLARLHVDEGRELQFDRARHADEGPLARRPQLDWL